MNWEKLNHLLRVSLFFLRSRRLIRGQILSLIRPSGWRYRFSKFILIDTSIFIAQFFIICLITIMICEISLRLFDRYLPSFIFFDGSYNQFRGAPFSQDYDFKLNSLGFKDVEFTGKQPSIYRIVAIGDSFAFGVVPYRHNYLTLLEDALKTNGHSVEVLNFGIPSIGPPEYLRILVEEGVQYKPDMVLLSFFIGNDFIESKKGILNYSYLYGALRYFFALRHLNGRTIHGKAKYCDDCPQFSDGRYLEIERDRSLHFVNSYRQFGSDLRKAVGYLVDIAEFCKHNKIDFRVVLIPDEMQVNRNLEQKVRKLFFYDVQDEDWNIQLPSQTLSQRLKEKDIEYIDLTPYFQKDGRTLYRPMDSHWNIAGNRLASQLISDWLGNFLVYKLSQPETK